MPRKDNVNFDSIIGSEIVNKLSTTDKTTASSVASYFIDMKKAFREMHRVLKPSGKACSDLGNTNLCGVEILNAEVAAEQLCTLGFEKVDYIKRNVPNKMITPWRDSISGKFTGLDNPNKIRAYEYEYIIIMQKN